MSVYTVGSCITNIEELCQQEFVYYQMANKYKILHKGWFLSYQMCYILYLLNQHRLYKAIKNEDHVAF